MSPTKENATLSMSHDAALAIRVYLFGDRFRDAVDVYSSAVGVDREAAAVHVAQIYQQMRGEPGFWRKAVLARLVKSLTIGPKIAFMWLVPAFMWAFALDWPVLTTGLWSFGVALFLGMLMAQAVRCKPHAFALGSITGGTALVLAVVGLVVTIIRRMV